MPITKNFKFIDLFSGIGGFHQAMVSFGGECVLASDIDAAAIVVYKKNYGIDSGINVRDIKDELVPDHDVLCAGFPCQAFSKAGKQQGFLDQTRGTLFFEIARILKAKHPKYVMLENVQNLVSHDNGNTYKVICETLKSLGYRIPGQPLILSPFNFGIPQVRPRVYIPGVYDPKNTDKPLELDFGDLKDKSDCSILPILEDDVTDPWYELDKHTVDVLNAWDEFHKGVDVKVIGFPVWSWCFDEKEAKKALAVADLPDWKRGFIEKNLDLYHRNKKFVDSWLKKWKNLKDFTATEKKFEWQAGASCDSIWDCIIQSRPSGIRVKKPDCFQALVAIVQVPIIGPKRRYMTVREAARLQSFPESFQPDENKQLAFKQFGNSVNVQVLKEIFKRLTK